MKAMVNTTYGPPSVLHLVDKDIPTPKANEVLIKVYATTVNRTDCGFLRAKPFIVRFFAGLRKPKHTVLGNEFAGVIEQIGSDVTTFMKGDKVFGYNGVSYGAHAQYMTTPVDGMLAKIPAGYGYQEIAPSTEGAHYAVSNLKKAKVRSGQSVLVYGATGGIGSAAVQIAKYMGAQVTAVCDTKNLALVKSLGADKVVDYTQEDFTSSTQKYDLVFDAVGKSSFGACKQLLKPKGMYCSTELGVLSQNIYLALFTPLFMRKKVLFPIPQEHNEDIVFIQKLLVEKAFVPVVDKHYPLGKIADAYKYVETGQKIGNVVITVSH